MDIIYIQKCEDQIQCYKELINNGEKMKFTHENLSKDEQWANEAIEELVNRNKQTLEVLEKRLKEIKEVIKN